MPSPQRRQSPINHLMPKPLWAPWRLEYVEHADEIGRCIFCEPEAELLIAEDDHALVVMNKFPYASGHLLVAPRRHVGEFGALDRRRSARDPFARGPRRRGSQGRVRPARVQPRLEPRACCGRRDRGPRSPPRRPALERRHELHACARRRESAARAPARDGQAPPRRVRALDSTGQARPIQEAVMAVAFMQEFAPTERHVDDELRRGRSKDQRRPMARGEHRPHRGLRSGRDVPDLRRLGHERAPGRVHERHADADPRRVDERPARPVAAVEGRELRAARRRRKGTESSEGGPRAEGRPQRSITSDVPSVFPCGPSPTTAK